MQELYILRMLQALRWTSIIQLCSLSGFAFFFQVVLSIFRFTNVPYRPLSFWFRVILYITTMFMLCVRFQKDSRALQNCSSFNRMAFFINNFVQQNLWTGITIMFTGAIVNWTYLSFLLPYNYTVMYNQCHDNKWCVNEVFVFIFTLGLWQGLSYFLNSYIFKQNEIFSFQANQQTTIFQDIKENILKLILNSFKSVIKSTLFFVLVYVIAKDLFINFFAKILLVYTSEKLSLISNLYLLVIGLVTNTMFIYSTNLILFIFNIVLTKRYVFTIPDLLRALSEQHQLSCVKKLAYLDLMLLVENNSPRRKEIYALSQPGGHPHTWNFVKDRCLQNITDYMKLLDSDVHIKLNPMPNLSVSNVQLHNYSNMRNLVSDSSYKGPQPRRHNIFTVLTVTLLSYIKDKLNKVKQLHIYNYLFSKDQIVLSQLNDYQCVLCSVRSLTAIICEALNEEFYGVICNDINDIILALLSFKNVLDDSASGLMQLRHSSKYKYKVELRYCVVQCLYKISNCYSNYLDSLQLPKNALLQLKSLSQVNVSKEDNLASEICQ